MYEVELHYMNGTKQVYAAVCVKTLDPTNWLELILANNKLIYINRATLQSYSVYDTTI
jgi:hypothetical protein